MAKLPDDLKWRVKGKEWTTEGRAIVGLMRILGYKKLILNTNVITDHTGLAFTTTDNPHEICIELTDD